MIGANWIRPVTSGRRVAASAASAAPARRPHMTSSVAPVVASSQSAARSMLFCQACQYPPRGSTFSC